MARGRNRIGVHTITEWSGRGRRTVHAAFDDLFGKRIPRTVPNALEYLWLLALKTPDEVCRALVQLLYHGRRRYAELVNVRALGSLCIHVVAEIKSRDSTGSKYAALYALAPLVQACDRGLLRFDARLFGPVYVSYFGPCGRENFPIIDEVFGVLVKPVDPGPIPYLVIDKLWCAKELKCHSSIVEQLYREYFGLGVPPDMAISEFELLRLFHGRKEHKMAALRRHLGQMGLALEYLNTIASSVLTARPDLLKDLAQIQDEYEASGPFNGYLSLGPGFIEVLSVLKNALEQVSNPWMGNSWYRSEPPPWKVTYPILKR